MGTFAQDSFTDSNATTLQSHTGETGATWSKISGFSGDATIDTNELINITSEAGYYASGAPASADYEVSADYSYANSSFHNFKVLGRVDTSTGDHYTLHYARSDSYFRLQKHISGTTTTLATSSGQHNISAGVYRNHKLALSGTSLEGFKDGATSVVSTTDSSITAAGKAGLRLSGTNPTRLRIDNFLATEAGSATVSPNNAAHSHSAGNATLGQAHALSISAIAHTHAAQNVVLSVSGTLDVANATHTHSADNLTLAQHSEIVVAAGMHGHDADMAALSQVHLLGVLSALHAHAASLAVLAAEGIMAPVPRRLKPTAPSTVAADARTKIMTAAGKSRSLTPER